MKAKVVLPVLILAAGVAAAFYFWGPFRKSELTLKLPGTVEIQEVRLGSKVGGRVLKVLVEEGQVVAAGDPLIEIELPELEAQRSQIKSRRDATQAAYDRIYNGPREEEKDAARSAALAAKARWDRMEAGYRPEEVEQAREDLKSLEADLGKATRELEREKKLLPTLASSSVAYDIAYANITRLNASIRSAKFKAEMMASGYRKEDKAEAKAEYEKLRSMYQLLEAGSRSEDKAESLATVNEWNAKLTEIETMLKEAVIVAPDKAVVEVVAVRKGDIAAPNQPVVKILRAGDLWVKAYISEIDIGKVRLNQEVEVTCDAYPKKRFKGKIAYIASIAEFTPRNVQTLDERRHQVFGIKVYVEDAEGVFKAGMAADVHLPLQ